MVKTSVWSVEACVQWEHDGLFESTSKESFDVVADTAKEACERAEALVSRVHGDSVPDGLDFIPYVYSVDIENSAVYVPKERC